MHVFRDRDLTDFDKINVYTAACIQSSSLLTEAGILLMAVLVGSNYDSVSIFLYHVLVVTELQGLKHCGIETALALAHSPLADSLYQAVTTLTPTKLNTFLPAWCSELQQQLSSNHGNFLSHCEPTTAQNITSSFPSMSTLQLYLNPHINNVDSSDWKLKLPNLAALASFADQHFSWAQDLVLINKFRSKIWPGYFTCQVLLVSICLNYCINTDIESVKYQFSSCIA